MAKARGKAPKTATKTARSPINGAVIPLGAHPGNTGGKAGRSGRRPLGLIELATDMARDDVLPVMQTIVQDTGRDDQARIAAGGKILSMVPKQEVVLTFTGQEDLVQFAAAIKRVLEDELPAKTLEALYPKIGAAFHEAHRTLTEGR